MTVRITVPATTANLGPGFDCLGLALQCHNTFTVYLQAPSLPLHIECTGEGAAELPTDAENLFVAAAQRVYTHLGQPFPSLHILAHNEIPLASGLGSSAAATVGGLAAANALLGKPLDPIQLLELAFEFEKHGDNAAAAIFGGLTLIAGEPPDLCIQETAAAIAPVVVVLPRLDIPTKAARAVLDKSVALSDAVFNIGRVPFVLQAMRDADYKLLGWAMQDRLHQPRRKQMIAGYDAVENAARQAGATAVVLSGAGPSLAAFAPTGHTEIAAAMVAAFAEHGLSARSFILPVDTQGLKVEFLPQ